MVGEHRDDMCSFVTSSGGPWCPPDIAVIWAGIPGWGSGQPTGLMSGLLSPIQHYLFTWCGYGNRAIEKSPRWELCHLCQHGEHGDFAHMLLASSLFSLVRQDGVSPHWSPPEAGGGFSPPYPQGWPGIGWFLKENQSTVLGRATDVRGDRTTDAGGSRKLRATVSPGSHCWGNSVYTDAICAHELSWCGFVHVSGVDSYSLVIDKEKKIKQYNTIILLYLYMLDLHCML